MGLLTTTLAALKQRWALVFRREPVPPTPPIGTVSVVNMPSAPVPQIVSRETPPVRKRVVEFRGVPWTEVERKENGVVRFVREIAVDGRAVESELSVHELDLWQRPDGRFTLIGRE